MGKAEHIEVSRKIGVDEERERLMGLVAILRKRVNQSLERPLCTPCPYCGGAGMVKSPQTVSIALASGNRRSRIED